MGASPLGRDTPPMPGASEFLVGGSERTPDARMAEKQALDRGYIYIGCGIAGVRGGTLIGPEPILNLDAAIFDPLTDSSLDKLLETPHNFGFTFAQCLCHASVPAVTRRRPDARSACRQSQTNTLKEASESEVAARCTSCPAANHPVGRLSWSRAAALTGRPPRRVCVRASCASIRR